MARVDPVFDRPVHDVGVNHIALAMRVAAVSVILKFVSERRDSDRDPVIPASTRTGKSVSKSAHPLCSHSTAMYMRLVYLLMSDTSP